MRGLHGKPGWAYLFLTKGFITLLEDYLFITTKSNANGFMFRGRKGWFSEREEKIIVNKVLRDDFAKAEMHNREAITPKTLFQAIKSWKMYPLYIIGLLFEIPKTPPTTYLTLTLRILWFSTVKTN